MFKMGFLRLIPVSWRLGLGVFFVLSFIVSLWYIRHKIYNAGFSACSVLYEKNKLEKERAARKKIIDLEKKYDEKIKEIESIEDNNSVGRSIEHAIDSL